VNNGNTQSTGHWQAIAELLPENTRKGGCLGLDLGAVSDDLPFTLYLTANTFAAERDACFADEEESSITTTERDGENVGSDSGSRG
jgi:hypothetical protein